MRKLLFALVATSVLAATPASAATAKFVFAVDILSGGLTGETFTGSFGYDTTAVVGIDEEFVELSSLAFDYQGTHYGLEDGVAEAAFFDGEFLGLSYSVDFPAPVNFSFIPGFFRVNEAFFSYEDVSGDGLGSISYTVIPVPGGLALLAPALIGVLGLRRSRYRLVG